MRSDDKIFTQGLTLTGVSGGDNDATGDYSLAPVNFKLSPPAGRVYALTRLTIGIIDNGPLAADSYGGGVALINGIKARRMVDGVVTNEIFGNETLKNNEGWAYITDSMEADPFRVSSAFLLFRWDFPAFNTSVTLNGDRGEEFVLTLNDDFTGLERHQFFAQGHQAKHYR